MLILYPHYMTDAVFMQQDSIICTDGMSVERMRRKWSAPVCGQSETGT
jgi:hypothetical protein